MLSDAETARRIVDGEPVKSGAYMRGDLRPYRLGLLRGELAVRGERE